jgi:hypothetical protein
MANSARIPSEMPRARAVREGLEAEGVDKEVAELEGEDTEVMLAM